jgi:hypothetical protein
MLTEKFHVQKHKGNSHKWSCGPVRDQQQTNASYGNNTQNGGKDQFINSSGVELPDQIPI